MNFRNAARPLALSLALLIVTACATAPQNNGALESARSAYRLAQADSEVRLHAPTELQLAGRSLAQAEQFWRSGADPAIVAHHAYLAEQRSRIAVRTADYRKAEAAVATSGEQRNRLLLEARNRELDAERERNEALKRAADERAAQLGAEMQRLQSQVSDLKTQQTDRGWVVTLRNELLFDSGRASLKPGGERAIENLAELMKRQPERDMTIDGFTDSTGSEDTNLRLSNERAQAVKQALVARGIAEQRIAARGYGAAFPVASNGTPTGRQLNRRVEVVIAPPARASAGGATHQ